MSLYLCSFNNSPPDACVPIFPVNYFCFFGSYQSSGPALRSKKIDWRRYCWKTDASAGCKRRTKTRVQGGMDSDCSKYRLAERPAFAGLKTKAAITGYTGCRPADGYQCRYVPGAASCRCLLRQKPWTLVAVADGQTGPGTRSCFRSASIRHYWSA